MTSDVPVEDKPYLAVRGGEPVVFHCHHYNAVLQQSVEDGGNELDAGAILHDAAAAVAYAQMRACFAGEAIAERLQLASAYFKQAGFGVLELSELDAHGGKVTLASSHYALGFRARSRAADRGPTCHFAAGFAAGVAAAAWDLPAGSFAGREHACATAGGDACVIELKRQDPSLAVPPSPGLGGALGVLPEVQPVASHIDEAKILAALAKLPLEGNGDGLIPAFGVYLTRHYANYYNLVSYEFQRRLLEAAPELRGAAYELLVEAGHVCAFNTFGGVMKSAEWDALVQPMIQERTDWVAGIVAVVNALSWGRWTVTELQANERLRVRIDNSYEANGYLGAYGEGDESRCYLATGAAAGIMNLLWVGDITAKPDLDAAFYDQLFSGPESFKGHETHCRAKGDPYCEVLVERTHHTS